MEGPLVKYSLVVIIDDNDVDLFLGQKVIESLGFADKTDGFLSAFRALEYFKGITDFNKLPDLLLLDINMPGINGFQFLDQLKLILGEAINKIKIFIVSSSEALYDKEKAKNYPEIERYIVKPLTPELLFGYLNC